jgi:uncharacterized membrane protein YkvA (DUF1232 family)
MENNARGVMAHRPKSVASRSPHRALIAPCRRPRRLVQSSTLIYFESEYAVNSGKIEKKMEVCVQTHRQRLATALKTRAGQLYQQFRILTRALIHPDVPWYAKLVCGCAVLYITSPIQLIPNFIPVIGQMDDVLVIGLSIRFLKRSVPQTVLDECQRGSSSSLVSAIPLDLPIIPSADLGPEALRKASVNKSLPFSI